MRISTRIAVAVVAGTALLGTATVAAAAAKPAGGTRARTESSATRRRPLLSPELRAQLRETGHVETVRHTRRRGDLTLELQRGTITAVSATSITLLSKDGYQHSYAVAPETKVRERGKPIAISELRVGERAMVVALRTPAGDVARRIGCLRRESTPGQAPNG